MTHTYLDRCLRHGLIVAYTARLVDQVSICHFLSSDSHLIRVILLALISHAFLAFTFFCLFVLIFFNMGK